MCFMCSPLRGSTPRSTWGLHEESRYSIIVSCHTCTSSAMAWSIRGCLRAVLVGWTRLCAVPTACLSSRLRLTLASSRCACVCLRFRRLGVFGGGSGGSVQLMNPSANRMRQLAFGTLFASPQSFPQLLRRMWKATNCAAIYKLNACVEWKTTSLAPFLLTIAHSLPQQWHLTQITRSIAKRQHPQRER